MPVEVINNLPAVEIAGGWRVLAALRPSLELRTAFARFSARYPVVPRDAWRDVDYSWHGIRTRDQRSTSSCTGHAIQAAFMTLRAAAGMPKVELSATFPYAQVNGGVDRGASVSALLRVLMQLGTCTEAECTLDQLFKNQISVQAYKTAEDYRLQEGFACRTFDEFASSLVLGFTGAIGIMVGQNFGRLDRNGVAPLPDVAIGGHALAIVGLKKLGGEWHLKLHNSWGENFGFDGGYCYISERHTQRLLDGFALVIPRESAREDDRDEPPDVRLRLSPPVVVSVPETPPPAVEPVVECGLPDAVRALMAEEDAEFLDALEKTAAVATEQLVEAPPADVPGDCISDEMPVVAEIGPTTVPPEGVAVEVEVGGVPFEISQDPPAEAPAEPVVEQTQVVEVQPERQEPPPPATSKGSKRKRK